MSARRFATSNEDTDLPVIESMRVSEIKAELQQRSVDFTDCFDKESLVQRLQEARASPNQPSTSPNNDDKDSKVTEETSTPETTTTTTTTADQTPPTQETQQSTTAPSTASATQTATSGTPSRTKEDLAKLSVKELRQELASRNLRWAGLLDKQDLIQAVYDALQAASYFSRSGLVAPGQVAKLTGDQVEQELVPKSANDKMQTPLLLDVYATW